MKTLIYFRIELQDRERACTTLSTRNSFGLLPPLIVNKKHINLKKTTSSVLSVILINLCVLHMCD